MKKRSCRRTIDEVQIHEKAVKMRKMTDEQLVHYVEDRVEKARSEGRNEAKRKKTLEDFLNKISEPGVVPGIGAVTIKKLMQFAKEGGYFE